MIIVNNSLKWLIITTPKNKCLIIIIIIIITTLNKVLFLAEPVLTESQIND